MQEISADGDLLPCLHTGAIAHRHLTDMTVTYLVLPVTGDNEVATFLFGTGSYDKTTGNGQQRMVVTYEIHSVVEETCSRTGMYLLSIGKHDLRTLILPIKEEWKHIAAGRL